MSTTTEHEENPFLVIAKTICEMTYGELMELGQQLSDMADGAPLDHYEKWASLLHSWASIKLEMEDLGDEG